MRRRPGFGRDLQQIAAALVGTAAATQVVSPRYAERAGVPYEEPSVEDGPDEQGAQAAEHTYQAPEGTQQQATRPSPYQLEVVGANGRRLIAHRGQDGRVWVGGCEFADMAELRRFAGWLTVWAEW